MQIQVVCVGRLKEKYWTAAIEEYAKRLGAYARLDIRELPDEKTPDSMSPAEEEQVRVREGERILSAIRDGAHVVALAIEGETWTSEQLAAHLDKQAVYGGGSVTFVIGGSLGLSPAVLARADKKLSFGRMTYPHQMMRVMLLEQVYRGFKIIRGEPYHK
ncbi:23S rRNA (pseudouridine(1915)-N(3))-methyltransferase RlmH [Cohnella sp. CIP 111063]|uniref:23S rRNA (pseudouridine(1915)-N(3))-methyltransferase RlmH n=1 Tax=unclassified Cohnella TaxID=2636738 RepID=UPI000B8C376D|nr:MULTISPECIES: 23S rRNA (pseudouridine(1915)-N(3))-methyltransferase RlmH [unclassified Cohnella]OXS56533.1 23S rRNA (pseudouridine(1915)-N(3))-methyltransferase RlmH [Cohnella sp. CIP 111063]PRX68712.1 23S rRNA (pseudouridine1915-N3)-methyltransferase [Cohnella sp. SGD-V74]